MTSATPPRLIVVMGVSGSGKSTVAAALAERLGWEFVEADDFHSQEAVARMRRGEPLTDAMREPWMSRLLEDLRIRAIRRQNCVLAWSGLRRTHRDMIRSLDFDVAFVLLQTDPEVLRQRLRHRTGHFMPASLLPSQLDTFDVPVHDERVAVVDAGKAPAVLLDELLKDLESGRTGAVDAGP